MLPTRLKMPIGQSDFGLLIRKNYYFVDKSLFIQEILEDSSDIILITRPRRFGKTLNLSMLRYYFAKEIEGEATANLFEGLKIKEKGLLKCYWINTSGNDLAKDCLYRSGLIVKEPFGNEEVIFSLLLIRGYFKVIEVTPAGEAEENFAGDTYCRIAIPNRESGYGRYDYFILSKDVVRPSLKVA